MDPRVRRDARLESVDETIPLELLNGRIIKLGTGLQHEQCEILTPTLINNIDLFAYSAADLPGVDPQVAAHKLSIYKDARYVSQKKRKLGDERRLVAHYTTWLSNVVLVKKDNNKWRMWTDYTNLNKAFPRDAYPLPNIDRLVNGAADNKVLNFLDAYSGYN